MSRMALAQEFLDDARLCLDNGRYRSAVSRAYYAAFHGCVALFEHYGYQPKYFVGRSGWPAKRWEHGIVVREFPIEFVHRRKLIDWRSAIEVRRLYTARIKADYREEALIGEAVARDSYQQAERLLAFVGGGIG